MPKVAVILGSDSDLPVVEKCLNLLKDFGVDISVRILSAHRTPEELLNFTNNIDENEIEIIIAAAGKAAQLPGFLASHTIIPVIGLPIKSSFMDGMDSLLSIIQMPKGIPVATVGVNASENAALTAVRILSLKYPEFKEKLTEFKNDMIKAVLKKDEKIRGQF